MCQLRTKPTTRKVLSKLEGSDDVDAKALLFASGMAATVAALQCFLPTRVIVQQGYHVTRQAVGLLEDTLKCVVVELSDVPDFSEGDLLWLESPSNPLCRVSDIRMLSDSVHAAGGHCVVDATFATAYHQKTLDLGSDVVMHSATKFYGGHSDVLAGVLATHHEDIAEKLLRIRTIMGNVPGSMEAWLLLRSLRTFPLRIRQQSASAMEIALFLEGHAKIARVWYPGLPSHPDHGVAAMQMVNGFGGILAIELQSETGAQQLARSLDLFIEATSLGGVESMVDWRYRYDKTISPVVLRLSVGVEDVEDLIADLTRALDSIGA